MDEWHLALHYVMVQFQAFSNIGSQMPCCLLAEKCLCCSGDCVLEKDAPVVLSDAIIKHYTMHISCSLVASGVSR